MIYVPREPNYIPSIFHSSEMTFAAEELSYYYKEKKEKRSQKRFSRPFEPELRAPILDALETVFHGKCAYCESLVDVEKSARYDHFRPKHGARGLEKEFAEDHYWWLTYEWRNFYYSCTQCNQHKATWFPVQGKRARERTSYDIIIKQEFPSLIDPCNENPESHFLFAINGTVSGLTERGRITIQLLELNRKPLVLERASHLLVLKEEWDDFIGYWKNKEANWAKLQEYGQNWAKILNETDTRPYVAASKQLLNGHIKDHQDIIQFFKNKEYEYKLETRRLTFPPQQIMIKDDHEGDIVRSEDVAHVDSPRLLTKYISLERLELSNYKCFDHLDLQFTARPTYNEFDQQQQPWLLFLGENGVGKSSILKAIALALMGASHQAKSPKYFEPAALLKRGKKKGFIKLTYNDGQEIVIDFSKSSKIVTNSLGEPVTNLIAYGSVRLLPKNGLQPEKGIFDGVKIGNLFDYTISLENATNWLLNASKTDFDKAAITIKDLMLLPSETLLTKDTARQQINVKHPGKSTVAIDDLSDGYRSIYALAVDIIATLSSENITYDLAEGVILIDEIETHLHPRWKMQVVERLRNAFPKLQFIVSTHEPLCLRGLQKNEAVVLRLGDADEVVAVTDLPDPSKLRIDQILTSEFFGLKSTMDVKTERLFEDYYAILAKDQEDRSAEENERSYELSHQIAKIKHLGNDTREDLVYYVIDELLAQQVKKDGMKMKELKDAALKRVQTIWDTINKTANDLPRP